MSPNMKICIFPKSQASGISLRGTHQRYILVCLVQQLFSMTKGALAKELAKKFEISLRNAYTHVYQELNDNLVPSGIVEVDGFLPATRGPRVFQMNGVPCFRLSLLGTVVAASLDEIDVEKWIELLQQYLGDDSIVQQIGRDTKDEILSHLDKFPDFTLELIRYCVVQFLEGKTRYPLENLKKKKHRL